MGADMKSPSHNIFKDEKGQVFFEFLLFFPLFLFLTLIIYVIGYSINASINQQKATRGYFYFITSHNSFAPSRLLLNQSGFSHVSIDAVGWREAMKGQQPVAECFSLPTFLGGNRNDKTCDPPSGSVTSTGIAKMVRLYTVYGICSATYKQPDEGSGPLIWMQKFAQTPPQFDCLRE